MFCDLLELLLDVRVHLQLDLFASVWPVNQEEPLLRVHLFNQDGGFLVVPHLKTKNTLDFDISQH